jgi:hypothetical protein
MSENHNTHWWLGVSTNEYFVAEWEAGMSHKPRKYENVLLHTNHGGANPFVFARHPYKRSRAVTKHPLIVRGLKEEKLSVAAPVLFNVEDTWRYCSPELLYNIRPLMARSVMSEQDLRFLNTSVLDGATDPLDWLTPASFLSRSKCFDTLKPFEDQTPEYGEAWETSFREETDRMVKKGCKEVYLAERAVRRGEEPRVKLWIRIPNESWLGTRVDGEVLREIEVPDDSGPWAESEIKGLATRFRFKRYLYLQLAVNLPLSDALQERALARAVRSSIVAAGMAGTIRMTRSEFEVEVYGSVLGGLYYLRPQKFEYDFFWDCGEMETAANLRRQAAASRS